VQIQIVNFQSKWCGGSMTSMVTGHVAFGGALVVTVEMVMVNTQ
jgi:hypothetical protein